MDLNSPLFDRIRVRPKAEEARTADAPVCEHPGCGRPGDFRAPKGRTHEGQYYHFCLDHVRAYNQSYNYFAGMSDAAVAAYQKDALTGHRPTWKIGVNGAAEGLHRARSDAEGAGDYTVEDPFGVFGAGAFARRAPREEKRRLSGTALKALDTLGLDEGADAAAIKARYKLLVKRFHPDANGGDRSFEARFHEIVRAYNTLRALGLA
ncbi:J domain-containing protein [Chelatococcus sp. SYSU_G07232]|uniref:J domain-containing protein n=1 Tax=Chelatococcus albus TaxID=3047466 RepID=A0ABT7ADD8_9HYPH|nr:J domain-containing protein [Chelatococcus sp. SYSU_G07232]MDJ1157396.1 J domain-containing protein [Chelatococcus sp. SYSU_G07232]